MAGNANSGRRRKSKALRELHGSVERPHHRDRPEPVYTVDVPEPPSSLSAAARVEWDRITAELNATRVIARVDLGILATYCTTFARLDDIRRELSRVTKAGKLAIPVGTAKWHRLERSERQQTTVLRTLAAELGITPASRARVTPLPALVPPSEPTTGGPPATDTFDALERRLNERKVVAIGEGRKTSTRRRDT